MTDWSEIAQSGNKCCSCTTDTENLIEATEATPLIRSDSVRIEIFVNNFDRLWIGCLAFIMITGTAIGIYLLILERQNILPDELDIVSRTLWEAKPPKNNNLTDLSFPLEQILIYQTNTTECVKNDECIRQMKIIQTIHVEVLNEPDILYNFIIAGDGRIYEGRGWTTASSENKNNSLAIAFVGTFTSHPPSEKHTKALLSLLDYAVIQKKVVPCFQLLMDHIRRRYLIDLVSVIKAHMAEHYQCDNIKSTN